MTMQECVQILAMLGAFYGGGKTDPKAQVKAWYTILQKYPYETAERAVINFAENDVRDYATFPAVGKIVQAIKNEITKNNAPIKEIVRAISYGHGYDYISDDAKRLISKPMYDEWLSMDAEEFAHKAAGLQQHLKGEQLRLGCDSRQDRKEGV